MASMLQRGNSPSSSNARQYWSQHNWDNLERLRMLDPYAEPRNVPGERLESQIPIQGTPTTTKPSPIRMLHLLREGSISAIAAEVHSYLAAGGNINERMMDDQTCPGVKELDTFLHVAFRHRNRDAVRHLLVMGADSSIQNWHLETARMVAIKMGMGNIIEEFGQDTEATKWAVAASKDFQPLTQVAPQRGVVEATYAWREGAPKTLCPTKAVFQYRPGSSGVSTRMTVQRSLPHQRELGPSAAVTGRPQVNDRRPHHHSASSPMSHISGTQERTHTHSTPIGSRVCGTMGSSSSANVAGSRLAGARQTPSAPVYNNCGTAC